MIKVIALDFGGVYFTWKPERIVQELARVTQTDEEAVRNCWDERIEEYQVNDISEEEYWDNFCENIGKRVPHALLSRAVDQHFLPIPGMKKLVQELRKTFKVVLLTNNTRSLGRLNEQYGFYRDFDEIINSFDVGVQKPQKEMFDIVLERTGARPEEVLFIDDSEHQAEAAKELGFKTILFTGVENLKRQMKNQSISMR